MSDNLILLLNQLSYQIVAASYNGEKKFNFTQVDESNFKKCVKKLRKLGCDVLLNKSTTLPPPDPCVTDYGGNWSPVTLLSDYAKSLETKFLKKYSDILTNSVKSLQEGDYDCVNDLLKFLLIIKGPSHEIKNEVDKFADSESNFSLCDRDSFYSLLDECMPCFNNNTSSKFPHQKNIIYEESWTKAFGAKFQSLGECSKKNFFLHSEKKSLDSLFKKNNISPAPSRTTFGFTDICSDRTIKNEKRIFDKKYLYFTASSLLDSFVDNPITHQLPAINITQKEQLSQDNQPNQLKKKVDLNTEKDQISEDLSQISLSLDSGRKVDVRRDSSFFQSFDTLCDKNDNSNASSYISDENSLQFNDKTKNKNNKSSQTSCLSNSKDIILGLWEHDKALIKEFRPELASCLPTLRMISIYKFIEDIKYLLTGINSESFVYQSDEKTFIIKYGTCLRDVTPESLYHFSKEFVEIGNCYKLLNDRAVKNCINESKTCNTIFQAFWKSIYDYLELHYSMILEIPVNVNLMLFKSITSNIYDMIITISNICQVFDAKNLPEDGKLITYLLQMLEKINKQNVKNVVVGILQNCCSVYLRCILQPWMFAGNLKHENCDFFIDYMKQKTNIKSRTYYKSFQIIKEKVPTFLSGFEKSILNCGKSIHFLKLFNSKDKFCQLLEKSDFPTLQLCLSENEFEKLDEKFKEYKEKVLRECGEFTSLRNLMENDKEKEKYYLEYVKECKIKAENERKQKKIRQLENFKNKKDIQNKLLNEEISKVRAEKLQKKLEEENAIREIEEKIKKAEEKEVEMIRQEKKKIIKYYNKMMRALDLQLNIVETRKQNLLKMSKNYSSNKSTIDLVNDNEMEVIFEISESNDQLSLTSENVDLNSNPIFFDANSQCDNVKSSEQLMEQNNYLVSFDENSNLDSTVLNNNSVSNVFTNGNLSQNTIESQEVLKNNKNSDFKSASVWNTASREAARNKIRCLTSEYGTSFLDSNNFTTKSLSENMNNAKKSKNIEKIETYSSHRDKFNRENNLALIKPISSEVEIVQEKENCINYNVQTLEDNAFKRNKSQFFSAVDFLEIVELESKTDFSNLNNSDGSEKEKIISNKSPSKGEKSGGIIYANNKDVMPDSKCGLVGLKKNSSLILKNPMYKKALVKDSKISSQKLSFKDVFNVVEEKEVMKSRCTDINKFERYLRKSIMIPLAIQEKLANDALLNHLLVGENLLSHFKSLKSFFLCDSEFARSLIQSIFFSLAKCSEAHEFFERNNLTNIVNEALHNKNGIETNNKNLSFKIIQMPKFLNHSSHDVLSPFELSYKVDWPLNIILTDKILSKYQYIFNFLMKIKRIIWVLNETSLFLSTSFKSRKMNGLILVKSSHYHKIQLYRYTMTQIMVTLDEHIYFNGIQLSWLSFLKDLETAENIDHLYQKHVSFIKNVFTRCFLSKDSEELLKCLNNIIEIVLKFHYTTVSSSFVIVDGKYEHLKFNVLKKTFGDFYTVMKTFLKILKKKVAAKEVPNYHYVLIEKFNLKLD